MLMRVRKLVKGVCMRVQNSAFPYRGYNQPVLYAYTVKMCCIWKWLGSVRAICLPSCDLSKNSYDMYVCIISVLDPQECLTWLVVKAALSTTDKMSLWTKANWRFWQEKCSEGSLLSILLAGHLVPTKLKSEANLLPALILGIFFFFFFFCL